MTFASYMPSVDYTAGIFESQNAVLQSILHKSYASLKNAIDAQEDKVEYRIVNKSPAQNLPGIMVDSKNCKKPRKDLYGNEISRNRRIHRVSFRDELPNQCVEDILYVQSFGEFNVLTEETKGGCACKIM